MCGSHALYRHLPIEFCHPVPHTEKLRTAGAQRRLAAWPGRCSCWQGAQIEAQPPRSGALPQHASSSPCVCPRCLQGAPLRPGHWSRSRLDCLCGAGISPPEAHRGPVTGQLLQRGAQRPPVRPKTDPRRPRVLSHGFTPRGGCETLGAPLCFLPPPSVQPRGPCVSCLGLKEARVYPKHEFPQLPMGPSVTWTAGPNSVGSLHQPSPHTLPKRLFPLPLTALALVPHP